MTSPSFAGLQTHAWPKFQRVSDICKLTEPSTMLKPNGCCCSRRMPAVLSRAPRSVNVAYLSIYSLGRTAVRSNNPSNKLVSFSNISLQNQVTNWVDNYQLRYTYMYLGYHYGVLSAILLAFMSVREFPTPYSQKWRNYCINVTRWSIVHQTATLIFSTPLFLHLIFRNGHLCYSFFKQLNHHRVNRLRFCDVVA